LTSDKDFKFSDITGLQVSEAQIQKTLKNPWNPTMNKVFNITGKKTSKFPNIPDTFEQMETQRGLVLLNVELEMEHQFVKNFEVVSKNWSGLFKYLKGCAHGVNVANVYVKTHGTW
jgi:hypothetical protein